MHVNYKWATFVWLLGLQLCCQVTADDVKFVKYYNTDSPNTDIGSPGPTDIPTLQMICASRPYCAGFNSAGVLKYSVSNQQNVSGSTLYVRDPLPPPFEPAPFNVWPQPANWTAGDMNLTVIPTDDFFVATGFHSNILTQAFFRYMDIIFAPIMPPNKKVDLWDTFITKAYESSAVLVGCNVNVLTNDETLQLGFDESYNLYIPSGTSTVTAELTANTVYGALRGLETLAQLVTYDWDSNFFVNFVPLNITDYPRYKHRGLLIDTGRHYLPVSTILQVIDAMAATKFNTLHWHLVDDPSFPYVSEVYPLLSEKGAFNPTLYVYQPDDVQAVIDYAALRGIRVMPELDTPAHTDSWFKGYPMLQGTATCGVDPTLDTTYEFVENLLAEASKVFPERYIHLGGDELSPDCWNSAQIQQWMKENNISSFGELEQYYENKVLAIANKLGFNAMVWADVFNNGARPAPETVITIWHLLDYTTLLNVVKAGYSACVNSNWYLNRPYITYTWADLYIRELNDGQIPDNLTQLIIGGEASTWGEWVDVNNLIPLTFPRACSAAEILWSTPEYTKAPILAAERLHQWRCRMNRRGIAAEPVGIPWGMGMCNPL